MYQFINPYNFAPFSSEPPQTVDKNTFYRGEERQKELMSGWLDVNLSIKTPLIIPDGAHPQYYDLKNSKYVKRKNDIKNKRDLHLEYAFLQLYNSKTEKKEYAISGSELRGLIRSTYETVTNSCLPFLMNDKPMSQRVPLYGALRKRGLLGYNGKKWVLYGTEKKLEEVIVVPVYNVDNSYFVENLEKVKKNQDNYKKDEDGNLKYSIIKNLDVVEKGLEKLQWNGKNIKSQAVIEKNRSTGKWQIKVGGVVLAEELKNKPNIDGYLFVSADGTAIKEPTASYVEGKGWLQYNVPVDTSRVYHVAYLTQQSPVYEDWEPSSAKGNSATESSVDTKAEAYKKLRSALYRDMSGNGGNNSNRQCNEALKKALEEACKKQDRLVPVYYFIVNNGDERIVYMSGSAAGRIAQRRKWAEIMQGHTPCEKELCPACLLFGTIKDGGMKGHIRVSDAFMEKDKIPQIARHTLGILGSPRTTAFEFYLKKPDENATFWNYDFYGVTETDSEDKNSHINYYHLEKALPRGRKMYWHFEPKRNNSNERKTNLNNTMESIEDGIFSFKVFFDQITKSQLTDLIWSITLGENSENSRLQHKIGHAKPLGYGSVKLTVTGGKIRKFSKVEENFGFAMKNLKDEIIFDEVIPTFDMNTEAVKSLLVMCNVDATGNSKVDYPRKENNGQIFAWFADNRTNAKELVVLPEPTEDRISLKAKDSKDSGEKRQLRVGNIVEASFFKYAINRETNSKFGIFVTLPGGIRALMHKKVMAKNLESYEGREFKVKISSITENRGRMEYSVTDKL